MKTTRLSLFGGMIALFSFISCQKSTNGLAPFSVNDENGLNAKKPVPVTGNGTSPYTISLAPPVQVNGNWEWVWTFVNNNPGNGNNNTVQNLSHWGFSPATCFSLSAVVSAAYSSNGVNWTSFNPSIGTDASSCFSYPVLKFDFGTSGNNRSYYKLVLNQYYPVGTATGYYKSGTNTGCGQFTFPGITCGTGGSGYSAPD